MNFGSIKTSGVFTAEETENVLKPITEFSQNRFLNLGEIHVKLTKPQDQEGFVYGAKQFMHKYIVEIFPLGSKSKASDRHEILTPKLDYLGEHLKYYFDRRLAHLTGGYKWQMAKNSGTNDEEKIQALINLEKNLPALFTSNESIS